MEYKNVALEQAKKNEVLEIKLEPVVYSESLGVDEIAFELTTRDDNHRDIEEKVSNRIKNENNYAKEWIQCDVKNEEVVEMQVEDIKSEKELEIAKLEVTEITEELILKDETDNDTFMAEYPATVCNRMSSEYAEAKGGAADITKIEKLAKIEGMDLEMFMDMKNFQDIDATQLSHDHSCASAKPDILLESAVEQKISRNQCHMMCKKGSKKSFRCYICNHTVYHKHHLISHMKGHKNAYLHSSSRKRGICMHCDKTFKSIRALDEHTVKEHPKFTASVSYKIHECTHCTYKTIFKNKLSTHILKHPNTAGIHKLRTCIHCNATFKRKQGLDDHTIRKHPDFIASVSSKIHECPHCTYATTLKDNFDRHMLKHPEAAGSYQVSTCIHCNATFKHTRGLDEHTIRKHPDFIASVSSKIHKCPHCTYATTLTSSFARHMLNHPEAVGSYKLSTCIHCNATFIQKKSLDNHIIREHPDFIASVSSKIHKCPHCTYAVVSTSCLARHMLKHSESAGSYKLRTCTHCNATFKTKLSLDNHIVRKHPDFIASVSSKIHKCPQCTYASTLKSSFASHMLKHPETVGSHKLRTCIHCNATFIHKRSLNDHTVKKHPDFIASVSSKIHECTLCTFKSARKQQLDEHTFKKHPDLSATISMKIHKLNMCIHCNATFKHKQGLDEHTIRKHPDTIASVSSKIHKCPHCTYATTFKDNFARHMFQHPETAGSYKLSTCIHCNATFKSKVNLDNHTIRKHPNFIASVSSKMHKCPHCTYATTLKSSLATHMLKHPESAGSYKVTTCIHCNATFKHERSLNDHIVKKHPDFIASVSSKIHECTLCTFKSAKKGELDEHILKKHPDLSATIPRKLHECAHCTYKTTRTKHFTSHTLKHSQTAGSTCMHCNMTFKSKQGLDHHIVEKHADLSATISGKSNHFASHMFQHPETAGSYKLSTCIHCNATYKSKQSLDHHTIRKHPDFIASVSSKIHKCPHCTYATTLKSSLASHILKHPETAGRNKFTTCIHCNAKFKSKRSLNDHTVKKHPDFIASVSSKIHECTLCTFKSVSMQQLNEHTFKNHPDLSISRKIHECAHCTYKTTRKDYLASHMLKHFQTAGRYKTSTCIHCNMTFKSKLNLDNHIVRKHPDFIASVRKIHKCPNCTYQTVFKNELPIHILKHPNTPGRYELKKCIYCNAAFKRKLSLDNHIVKKHPDSIASISSKIHKCPHCTYATILKSSFASHMLNHPESAGSYKLRTCIHCNATFKHKWSLNDHIVRKHPDFISSVSSKIHECTLCTYKSARKRQLDEHTFKKHPDLSANTVESGYNDS